MILVAVAIRREIGVDVEKVRGDLPFLDIARQNFSDRESSIISALPPRDMIREFFRIWVRKEACIKAMGKGLSMALRDIDVLPGLPDQHIAVNDVLLSVVDLNPIAGYAGALAVTGGVARIRMISWTLARLDRKPHGTI